MNDKLNKDTPVNTEPGYEKSDVKIRSVWTVGVIGVVLIVLSLVWLNEYFISAREQMVYESVLKPESALLRDLRARETEELGHYAVIDTTKGVYRVPIERAMKLMAEEAYQTESESR